MIIARRSAAARLSTDPIAASVSAFIATTSAPQARVAATSRPRKAELDLARLYPNLFGASEAQPVPAHRGVSALLGAR